MQEVGSEFNVTRERIRQIEKKALDKIRVSKATRDLRIYIDDDYIPDTPIRVKKKD